jgi:hypothetical protein
VETLVQKEDGIERMKKIKEDGIERMKKTKGKRQNKESSE